eukprot:gnl/MRDRNA2_/MRDRNA2_96775_c0_seq1.p1 gnl/MRDRNA2_/MRDRNA2_96775_c0~~gnl/MRDRNA2_/MRDRNA2_96775_c0_seq1.p1  ORF type:complete len:127 (-),score=27.48 gnl/MRDRNA2_/MRDRNA2_96775_c0_seq1:23-355(-)
MSMPLLLILLGVAEATLLTKQPISDADLQHTGDTGYPCPASGEMIDSCKWYSDFVKENPDPPRSIKKPYIYGGSDEWHGPDPEMIKACEKNYNEICVRKNPLCSEHFDKC